MSANQQFKYFAICIELVIIGIKNLFFQSVFENKSVANCNLTKALHEGCSFFEKTEATTTLLACKKVILPSVDAVTSLILSKDTWLTEIVSLLTIYSITY